MTLIQLENNEVICINCKYYRTHYVKLNACNQIGYRYIAVNCGHCIYPRIKRKKPNDTCEKWEEKEK